MFLCLGFVEESLKLLETYVSKKQQPVLSANLYLKYPSKPQPLLG